MTGSGAAYDSQLTAQRWLRITPRPDAAPGTLRYSEQIRGVTSYLLIGMPNPQLQLGVRSPGGPPVTTPPAAPAPAGEPPLALAPQVTVRLAAAPHESAYS